MALITDGKFSGSNNGCFVGHILPKAIEGSPFSIIQDGDEIIIDIENGKVEADLTGEQITDRLRN